MRDPKSFKSFEELVKLYGRPQVRAAVRREGVLTERQRAVIGGLLRGETVTDMRQEQRVSRQAIFKVRVAAVRALREHIGTRRYQAAKRARSAR
jgi:hypothetical protein